MKYILLLSLLFVNIYCFAQSKEQIKNAKDFSFEGLKLGSSLSSFKAKYPNALEETTSNENIIGIKNYRVIELNTAERGLYYFFENKLYKMLIFYSSDYIDKMGGGTTLVNKMVAKFGLAEDSKNNSEEGKATMWWTFENVGRYIELTAYYKPLTMRLYIEDSSIDKRINEKKANSVDIGF